jgi:hypothetical protein
MGEGPEARLVAAGNFEFGEAKLAAAWDGLGWSSLSFPGTDLRIEFPGKGPLPAMATLESTPNPMLFLGGEFSVSLPQDGCDSFAGLESAEWSCFGGEPDEAVSAMLALDEPGDPRVLVGGAFYQMGGEASPGLAILHACPTCAPDCDSSGSLDASDFVCFTALFNAGDAAADCDANLTLDLFDFLCFVNTFNEGC